jgi:hypothetical protein
MSEYDDGFYAGMDSRDEDFAEKCAEIERLRAALKPFAAQAYDREGLPPDWEIGTRLSDLRAAPNTHGQDAVTQTPTQPAPCPVTQLRRPPQA